MVNPYPRPLFHYLFILFCCCFFVHFISSCLVLFQINLFHLILISTFPNNLSYYYYILVYSFFILFCYLFIHFISSCLSLFEINLFALRFCPPPFLCWTHWHNDQGIGGHGKSECLLITTSLSTFLVNPSWSSSIKCTSVLGHVKVRTDTQTDAFCYLSLLVALLRAL